MKNSDKQAPRSDTKAPSKKKQRSKEYLEYQSYIRSKYWREVVRAAVLERDGYRCVCCGRTAEEANLTVHHSTYDCLYHEMEGDNLRKLVTLCQYCHKGIHSVKSNFQRFRMKKEEEEQRDEAEQDGAAGQ